MIGDEKYVTSGGLRLWTERFGDRDDPGVLLVMGTSAQAIGWPDELVARLVHSGRQVVRFDHRDTGLSDCVDFTANPYTLADMTADTLAVLDGHGIDRAHVVGVSLGGAIGQWLAVHHRARVQTLTAIMTSPMGNNAGPAWARAIAGRPAAPDELPPPAPRFLRHVVESAHAPRATPEQRIDADLRTWRVLNGEALPFDEPAARRFVERSHQRAHDPAAAGNHDLAGRQFTEERLAPLSSITAPTLVIHGSEDPIFATAHAEALAAQVPGARLHVIDGMGHNLFSPGLPERIADLVADHTATR
ncbi:alpha/beta fold hydrolase [Actinophytocola oryzae]|uniref:Pimeloyl-ACP methyl ester carboxylesterase n=1 Tax=Actinophytocola oryzae TaxID=502181 RepID=A0A4R7W1U4_9PSEU|nr:alpha/beta hydrolase [Actinophytocola oryzae]TDV56085.1 pimeloyl-ACP methyl ester carboxylesterase [Actinophytocola oryzae]